MTDQHPRMAVPRRSLHPYVSDQALAVVAAHPDGGWEVIDGSLAFFDISGFTKLTERLAGLGRSGAEHINDVLNTVFAGLIERVFQSGGDVLEFGGDAMVVLFTGDLHARRAAVAAARMFRFVSDEGRIVTPAGDVRLRMSCGMASGTQAYHLLGSTRRALVVAGPVSTAMAALEAVADAGEARLDDSLAAALPASWIDRGADGVVRLRLGRVAIDEAPAEPVVRQPADQLAIASLLPTQFHSLIDAHHRAGELKQVAMSFIRLNGTDDMLASFGIAALHDRLGEITDLVDHASAELDVCWLETQAEANSVRWTLIAGAPTATERDGERLLRVLRKIADHTPLPLRIGANLGVVFVGDMGHPQRCTFIVMGDATNLAARLMARATPGEIIAGEHLHNTCPSRFESTPLEPFLVKGKRAPVRAFLVGQVSDDDVSMGTAETTSPMVGRQAELERLLDVINSGGIVDIVGEAGSGKTRLWQQARLSGPTRRWLITRAEPHEAGSPYLPFRRLIRTLAGIGQRDDEHVAGERIAAFVEHIDPSLTPWLPLVADVIGAHVEPTAEVDALDPAFRADRLRIAVADLLAAVAADDTVIVFEDLHWIDDASRALLEVLSRVLPASAALVLTRRPVGWCPPPTTSIELAPIDDEFAEELLLRELPARAASDATLARLRGAAAGNPMYLIELARSVAMGTSSTTEFPETVERVLAARIDQLPISGRELIRDVAVLGSTMSRRLASRVLERDDLVDAETWVDELGDLMIVGDDTVRFRHDLVRVAAYQGLSLRRRRALHQRAGDVIEEWGDTVPLPDPIAALAFHASGSEMPDRIIRWNGQAAEAAISKGAMEIAESLLHDVVGAQRRIEVSDNDRSATQRRLAFVAERAGHPDLALDALTAASRLTDQGERCLIAVDRARVQGQLGRYSSALATTARALKTCDDEKVSGHLRLSRATMRNFQGRWRECLEMCTSLLGDFPDSDDRRLLAKAHVLAEWCCMGLGLPERGEHERAALMLLEQVDDSIGIADLLLNRGESAWRENRAQDAIADFRASSERCQRAGDVVGAALADNNLAEVLTLQFHLEPAEALLTHAQRVMQAASYAIGTISTVSGLSRIAAWTGHIDDALALQSEALAGFRELHADDHVADALVRLVEIHLLSADLPATFAAIRQAEKALTELGDVPVLPATLWRLKARAYLHEEQLEEARRWFERAHEQASADGFLYEVALAAMGLAQLTGDTAQTAAARAQLSDLGVVAPPPGT